MKKLIFAVLIGFSVFFTQAAYPEEGTNNSENMNVENGSNEGTEETNDSADVNNNSDEQTNDSAGGDNDSEEYDGTDGGNTVNVTSGNGDE